jgi:hypothetical protein
MNDSTQDVIVDPRFAIESRDISDFLGEFGPFNGRYVPRFPSNWVSLCRDHIADLSFDSLGPVRKQAVLERIRRELPLCLVPVGWGYDPERQWADNAIAVLNRGEMPIVVGDALDPTPFMPWIDAVEDIRQTRRRSWPFFGTVSEYLDACRPLLLNSPASYLIDGYLDPFSDVAEYVLNSMFIAAKGSKCYSIEIITRRSACGGRDRVNSSRLMRDSDIALNLERIYGRTIPRGRTLKLHIVTEGNLGSEALRLHDRFFLTMHGSINFGQGFLLVNQRIPQQNAFVTDKDHHVRLKQTYIDGVARHLERLPRVPGIAYPHKVVSICV